MPPTPATSLIDSAGQQALVEHHVGFMRHRSGNRGTPPDKKLEPTSAHAFMRVRVPLDERPAH
jgi:hypothetical protein